MQDYSTYGPSDVTRFWSKVYKTEGCWLWAGALAEGYGVFALNKQNLRAHRFAYLLLNPDLPKHLVLHHVCENRACVRPDHLQPMTIRENIELSPKAHGNETHCPHGHPYDKKNTCVTVYGRICRTCARLRMAEKHAVLQAERGGPKRSVATKTHCAHGHEFTDESSYMGRDGWRRCRICQRESDARRYEKRRRHVA